MNTKEIILNSGFSYQELLTMKNNFHAMRKWYRLEKKPVPATEPENFQKYILSTAEISSSCTLVLLVITLVQTIILHNDHHDLRHPALGFIISLLIFMYIIYDNKIKLNLSIITILRLITLHYRIKIITCVNRLLFKP